MYPIFIFHFGGMELSSYILGALKGEVKAKSGAYATLRVASVLISATLALEPVVGQDPLSRDTGPVCHPGYHSFTFPRFPQVPIYRPTR